MLCPLISRIATECGAEASVIVRSAEGGSARALASLKQYAIDLKRGQDSYFEILVVAIDGNCNGWLNRKKQIEELLVDYAGSLVVAIPDPHIELWYLADRAALPAVLDEHFTPDVPAMKCEKDRYKDALRAACRIGGVEPTADGVEYGGEIARSMSIEAATRNDKAFERFVDDLRAALSQCVARGSV